MMMMMTVISSAGSNVIRQDARFSLAGYNLSIARVEVRDEGDYICQVESYSDPIQQTTTLNVLIPAVVQPFPRSGQYVVRWVRWSR